jgi:ATP-dependent DNA helicase RecQ
MREKACSVLKNTFGYSSFREKQEEVILNVLSKKDTLAVMPTGSGKSLCYQIPALIFQGLTIVVSPLISLMQDQVEQLTGSGVEAVVLNSSLSREEYLNNIQKIENGNAKLLFVAPETLLKDRTLELLSSVTIDCFTIDEAHCISEWGHDFRPEYRMLSQIRNHFPAAVCLALTATATERVRKDIQDNLTTPGKSFETFVTSFNRKNLFLEIIPKNDPYGQAVDFIRQFPDQSGIIYCFSRKQVDELYEHLLKLGYSVKPYHAGLSEGARTENQRLFIRDDIQIIVATVAFGMGINKPNVRFVLHFDLPKNIESYYQEIGRAGRDGLDSRCLLLFSYGDIRKIRYFISQKSPDEQRIANIHLNALVGMTETYECRRRPLLHYFGETFSEKNCGTCDNCTGDNTELSDVTVEAQKFLSCVKRTGEKFGASHIIDVLRGSKGKKVLEKGHHELSTYNIGADYTKNQWRHLFRQFIRHQLLEQDEEFGSLKLTDKAYLCFQGKLTIKGTVQEAGSAESKRKNRAGSPDYDGNFFEILRKKRKEIADEKNVPPYVVFSDKTLMEISASFPASREELLQIHGIGRAKSAEYGELILKMVSDYTQQNPVNPEKTAAIRSGQPAAKTGKEPRYIQLGREFNRGRSVKELAEELGVLPATILKHLHSCVFEGYALRNGGFLEMVKITEEELKRVMRAFDDKGTHRLKPVFEELNGEIPYEDLHVLRLHYLSRGKPE